MVASVKYQKVPVEAEEHYHCHAEGRGGTCTMAFHVIICPDRSLGDEKIYAEPQHKLLFRVVRGGGGYF